MALAHMVPAQIHNLLPNKSEWRSMEPRLTPKNPMANEINPLIFVLFVRMISYYFQDY